MSEIRALVPPYNAFEAASGGAGPPLGAIVICPAASAAVIAGPFRLLLQRAPWCAPCLVTGPTTGDPDVLAAIHELPGHLTFVSPALNDEVLVATALAAVGYREAPTGGRMAEYVTRRTGRTEFRAELTALLAREPVLSLGEVLPTRTLRGRLRRFGRLTGHCWETIGTLCRLGATVSDDPVELLAWRAGVESRTLRAWTRRFLDVTLHEFRERVGWEWVLESALLVAGYLSSEKAVAACPAVFDNLIVRITPLPTPVGLRRISRQALHALPSLSAPPPKVTEAT